MAQVGPDSWVVRSAEPLGAEVADGVVLCSVAAGVYVSLNDTAAAVWRRLAQPIQLRALCGEIAHEFDVVPEECSTAVIACVSRLIDAGLADIDLRLRLKEIEQ
jgi:hypothetical protein